MKELLEDIIESSAFDLAVEIVLAPLANPEIIPTVLPLVMGLIVLELYFGKYERESLGWNTALGNSIIWITTAVSLIMTEDLATPSEQYAAYILLGIGLFIAYMNFNHAWGESLAFVASAPFPIYTYAYITVVLIKTDIPINRTAIEASIILFVSLFILSRILQLLERPRDEMSF